MIHVNEDEIVQKLIEEGKLDEAKKYVKCLIEKCIFIKYEYVKLI